MHRLTSGLPASCRGLVAVNIQSALPLGCRFLTHREQLRYKSLAHRRRPGFLAARIALKKLYLTIESSDPSVDLCAIETVSADMTRPCCVGPDKVRHEYVSAAHNRTYAIAVAGRGRVGVDVETKTEVLWRGRHLYMSSSEQRLVVHSGLGRLESAVRIWSAKEAAAKALNLDLTNAWREVTLTRIENKRSTAEIQGVRQEVHHAELNDHLFSVLFHN